MESRWRHVAILLGFTYYWGVLDKRHIARPATLPTRGKQIAMSLRSLVAIEKPSTISNAHAIVGRAEAR
jgi:hypothetical protein